MQREAGGVMVLAAGLGTRLKPLTDAIPKPLVPIGDRAAIFHVLDRVRPFGAPIVVNAHAHAHALEHALAGSGVIVSVEDELLGTAGGVAKARSHFGTGDILVYNADIVSSFDVAPLLARPSDCRAMLAVAFRSKGEGNVGVDGDNRIVRLRKESFGDEIHGGEFLGVHAIDGSVVFPAKGCLVGDVYLPMLRRGEDLVAHEVREPFIDVGSMAEYQRANLEWLGERASFCGRNASVSDGVSLEQTIVGDGASVTGAGVLRRVIVWPGATAVAPLEDAVVMTRGVVAVKS